MLPEEPQRKAAISKERQCLLAVEPQGKALLTDLASRVRPCLDLHRGVAKERAVAVGDVADKSDAA